MVVSRFLLPSLKICIFVLMLVEMGVNKSVEVDGLESTIQRRHVTDCGLRIAAPFAIDQDLLEAFVAQRLG